MGGCIHWCTGLGSASPTRRHAKRLRAPGCGVGLTLTACTVWSRRDGPAARTLTADADTGSRGTGPAALQAATSSGARRVSVSGQRQTSAAHACRGSCGVRKIVLDASTHRPQAKNATKSLFSSLGLTSPVKYKSTFNLEGGGHVASGAVGHVDLIACGKDRRSTVVSARHSLVTLLVQYISLRLRLRYRAELNART